jgi:hypothetical protein
MSPDDATSPDDASLLPEEQPLDSQDLLAGQPAEDYGPLQPFVAGWLVAAVFVVILLFISLTFLSPLWAGYFGPRAAAYAAILFDSPGFHRIKLTREDAAMQTWPQRAVYRAEYAGSGGRRILRVTLWRSSRWRPWQAEQLVDRAP